MRSRAERVAQKRRGMARAGKIVRAALDLAGEMATPGRRTEEIDAAIADLIRERGAKSLFLGYQGLAGVPFPATICSSINEAIVHGIPGPRELREGDILSVDVGVSIRGWCGDAAETFAVGRVSDEAQRLLDVTRGALERAVEKVVAGRNLAEVSGAVQSHAELNGFSVVKAYTGHAIGKRMHEQPQVPNFVDRGLMSAGTILKEGLALAIEPMVNAGTEEVESLPDGWTVVTRDGSLSAHFEHTVMATSDGPLVLTG